MRTTFVGALVAAVALVLGGCGGPEPQPEHDHATHSHDHGTGGDHHHAAAAVAKDPICGMEVASPTITAEEGGQRFAFCSEQCKTRFQQDPHRTAQAAFDRDCSCRTTMQGCDCGHCTGKFEPCPCGS